MQISINIHTDMPISPMTGMGPASGSSPSTPVSPGPVRTEPRASGSGVEILSTAPSGKAGAATSSHQHAEPAQGKIAGAGQEMQSFGSDEGAGSNLRTRIDEYA